MDSRPELQLIVPGASVEEIAAIVGALEFASGAGRSVRAGAGAAWGAGAAEAPAAAGTGEPGRWVLAGLREGVDRAPAPAPEPAPERVGRGGEWTCE
ncbi:MAG: hypothetical protein QOH12_3394 [Solirubrobacteraceae bacterium]|nr:hypothetical protein [Solirubrobacteraceae bacterium]